MASRINLLNRPEGHKPQSLEPTPKRQKTSSVTSESTLAAETSNVTPIEQGFCSVASEDLSSMMFQVADLQRFANSWALHNPSIGTEFEMKASFKACEETANSLRDTIESLEVNAASLASAQDLEAAISNSHDPPKDNNVDKDKTSSEYEAKCVYPPTIDRVRILTVW
jgi:DNA mismatch repair ATPase MutS